MSWVKQSFGLIPLPCATSPWCIRTVMLGGDIYQTRLTKCIQLGPHMSRQWMENCFHNYPWSLPVSSYALWSSFCPHCFSVSNKQHSLIVHRKMYSGIHWCYLIFSPVDEQAHLPGADEVTRESFVCKRRVVWISCEQDSILYSIFYIISADGVERSTEKVKAVQAWPISCTIEELQRFLGFASFYCHFRQGFSTVAVPLKSILNGGRKKIMWMSKADWAFQLLKRSYTTAPILQHPDPNKPFSVEMDASNSGVGVVLSQQVGEKDPNYTPSPHKLSQAQRNYDVCNQELHAVKLALEEWRHWREGTKFPFTIYNDHKNLECLNVVKRLNPRQAHWALFFTRFNFSGTYRPGSHNTKADALSRTHPNEHEWRLAG